MNNLIQEMNLQEMKKANGGQWVTKTVNGIPTIKWEPEVNKQSLSFYLPINNFLSKSVY